MGNPENENYIFVQGFSSIYDSAEKEPLAEAQVRPALGARGEGWQVSSLGI